MSDLAAALMVAIRVHAGQVDKQGEPYLLHVLRVVEGVSDEAKVVAALHDVIEDGTLSKDDCANAGLSFEGRGAIYLLTRDTRESYATYIERIASKEDHAGRLARQVKIADLRDHLETMPPEPPWRPDGRGPDNAPEGSLHAKWRADWESLRRRYERALATLQGGQG